MESDKLSLLRVRQARDHITDALAKTLLQMTPSLSQKFTLQDSELNTAIAKAAIATAAMSANVMAGRPFDDAFALCEELDAVIGKHLGPDKWRLN